MRFPSRCSLELADSAEAPADAKDGKDHKDAKDGKDQKDSKEAKPSTARAPRQSALQIAFVDLLNRLILQAPTSTLGKAIASRVNDEVSETLSVGMEGLHGALSVMELTIILTPRAGSALQRIKILSELIQTTLHQGAKVSAQHNMLLTKYFASQAKVGPLCFSLL